MEPLLLGVGGADNLSTFQLERKHRQRWPWKK